MEIPSFPVAGGNGHSIPGGGGGPVLYVNPLRFMSPSGAQPYEASKDSSSSSSPAPASFGMFYPEWLKQKMYFDAFLNSNNNGGSGGFPPPPPAPGGSTPKPKPKSKSKSKSKGKGQGPNVGTESGGAGGGSTSEAAPKTPRKAPSKTPPKTPSKTPSKTSPSSKKSPPGGTSSSSSAPKRPKSSPSSAAVATPSDSSKKLRRISPSYAGDPKKALNATIRLYDAFRRNLLQEEEIKGKDVKGGRPDLVAGSLVYSPGLDVNRGEKMEGHFPGIEIGEIFYFRMEISCVGLHGPIQGGIEYFTSRESKYPDPVAISVISAGGYDAKDDGEVLIYTGQGGKGSNDSKQQSEDQKLERGNLALEGSMKQQVPVRVIRGIKDPASPSGKIYTYDGLYKIESSWSEKGKAGFEEFKFKLTRIPGQPELGSVAIKLSNQLKYKPSMRVGVTMEDLSAGSESHPVYVVNTVDSDTRPAPFEYSKKVGYPEGFSPEAELGCECSGPCPASGSCRCFSRNGDEFAYLTTGVLVREKSFIYECGASCKCAPTCRDRVTQKGSKFRFEVFKTENNSKGWGLRSWDPIPAGTFVCEYVGKLANRIEDIENKEGNAYLLNTKKISKNAVRWGDVTSILKNKTLNSYCDIGPRPDLYIDASTMGNMSRFINHSCSPNLMIQCVLHDHDDLRYPHIMLFAMDNIPPFRELTLDYGYETFNETSQDATAAVTGVDCLCGATSCRGKLLMQAW